MWQEQLAAVRAQLALAGLDVVHPLAVGWVEDLVAVDRPAAGLGLLIGNSKALWSRLAPHPDDPHPVNSQVERAVTEATALLDPVIRFAHRRYAGAFVPMQRVAERVGLAQLSPSMLCVYPEFGTWFSLRALALSADPGPVGEPTKPQDFC